MLAEEGVSLLSEEFISESIEDNKYYIFLFNIKSLSRKASGLWVTGLFPNELVMLLTRLIILPFS